MMKSSLLLLLGAALATSGFVLPPCEAQATGIPAGTWFGSIVLTHPDGSRSHDTAVLVIDHVAAGGVHGGLGRTIDQMSPWTAGTLEKNHLSFHLDAAGGLNVSLARAGEHLAGTAVGPALSAQIDLTLAPGLLPHPQLLQEITSADRQLYAAFENCDEPAYAALLDKGLEFYQDRTGRTGYEENRKALQDRCAEGIRLRRELDPDSLVVNAAPGFGAIQAGTQRFYSRAPDGQEHLDATARFTNVWSKASGTWKLVRVISYDHR